MSFYPFYSELQEEAQNFEKGNFSLWFNKILFKVDDNGKLIDDTRWAENMYDEYKKISQNKQIQDLINEKIKNQKEFAKQFSDKYKIIEFEGTLKSDFIIGLGESHPTELGMILDHLTGVPYIPASTIKGAVRFAYTLNYIDKNKENLPIEEEYLKEKDTPITKLFGGENKDGDEYVEKIGKIIFLDAYCEKTPKLKLDVMTPHYGKYYSENIAPADNQDPNPLKFLVIERGQKFIFNILIDNSILDEKDNIVKAFKRALEEEGIGVKTAIGYGRFKVDVKEVKSEKELKEEKIKQYLKKIKNGTFNFDSWQNEEEYIKNNLEIAQTIFDLKLVKPKKSNGEFRKDFITLAKILNSNPQELLNKLKSDNNKSDDTGKNEVKEDISKEKRIKGKLEKIKKELIKGANKKAKKKLKKEFDKLQKHKEIELFQDLVNDVKTYF